MRRHFSTGLLPACNEVVSIPQPSTLIEASVAEYYQQRHLLDIRGLAVLQIHITWVIISNSAAGNSTNGSSSSSSKQAAGLAGCDSHAD